MEGESAIETPTQHPSPGAPPAARWTPADFLLRGRFCSLPSLQARLQELRVGLGARAALLLVADERAVLRTLRCPATHGPCTQRLTAALQQSRFAQSAGLQDAVHQSGPTGARKSSRSRSRASASEAA